MISLSVDRRIGNTRMIRGLGMNARVHSYLMKFMYKMSLYIEWGAL